MRKYRACEKWSGVPRPHLFFAVSRLFFTLLLWYTWTKLMYELCDFRSVPHGSESNLLGFGAVMMLGGRQSGETFRSTLPEPILNVDILIVTFKFLPCLTAHEKHPSLIYRKIWKFAHDFPKSLQFVHGDCPSCIVSTRDFCWWWRWFLWSDLGKNCWNCDFG